MNASQTGSRKPAQPSLAGAAASHLNRRRLASERLLRPAVAGGSPSVRYGWALLALAATMLLLALAGGFATSLAQEEVLKDPVALGAWLYEGQCVGCHGAYAQARLAGLYDDETALQAAIEGGGRGCQVSWGAKYGGPLRGDAIKALVQFMAAWEERGAAPDLPPLPPQPTPTPQPTAPAAQAIAASPTPTPTPELAPKLRLIIEGSELALGAWLYTQHCHRCHLEYGYSRMARALAEKKVESTIRSGKSGTSMPAFSRREGGDLSVREIQSIVRYVMAFEQLNAAPALPADLFTPPTPDPSRLAMIPLPVVPPVSADARAGARWYALHCSRCHGLAGEGGIGPALARPWPSVRPDLTIRAAIADGIPGAPMHGWKQTADAALTDQQIDDLVIYLLQMAPVLPLAMPPTPGAPRR